MFHDFSGGARFFAVLTLLPGVGRIAGATDLSFTSLMAQAGPGTPEPSSFILCGLGALGLFLVARRRRKT